VSDCAACLADDHEHCTAGKDDPCGCFDRTCDEAERYDRHMFPESYEPDLDVTWDACAHCWGVNADLKCPWQARGFTEWKARELAIGHIRETGHTVMLERRIVLGPAGSQPPPNMGLEDRN
jgi:hypothetical protein